MGISNRDRVGRAIEHLSDALAPFVDEHMARAEGPDWLARFAASGRTPMGEYSAEDPALLLLVVTARWDQVFRASLPRAVRALVVELRDVRNRWAHRSGFSAQEAFRALDSMRLILEAIGSDAADVVRESQDELGKEIYLKERERDEARDSNVLDGPTRGLRPWREVVLPHDDVAAGRFGVAEFAADLERVRQGDPSASAEYRDPEEFFRRTYLTRGLRDLLRSAVRRVSGSGGPPVINCQTNFGGGKTHSLIALYHLFSGVELDRLPSEIAEIAREGGADRLPKVKRAVVVGNRFAPGRVHSKPDGTQVRTIWGEIAWQLGEADGSGEAGYAIVADSDRTRSNPGDDLTTLLRRYAPCLVLIDEWVAYARELVGRDDLEGGSFGTQFGFAQALTEAASAVDGAFVVVSIPASEAAGPEAGEAESSSLEVGGSAGREALARLTNAISRVAEHWQPASSDESFEIVRRRLFQPIDEAGHADRDAAADAFGDLYRRQRHEFPAACAELRYVEAIKAAYPIHPEVFERLYRDWSTIDRFQRTRGVLRLMAGVVQVLWESNDQSPLILPCSIPLDHPQVNAELVDKLEGNWRPVIDADVDGAGSRPSQIDRDVPALGRYHATRRVARTIFLGSAPTLGSANRGIEVERIRLGSSFPGEPVAVLGDALGRLSDQAPHLYGDRGRYWFDLQENVNRTARDEADRLLVSGRDLLHQEIADRIRAETASGDFRRVHPAPRTTDDVADEPSVRLVILGPEAPHIARDDASPALLAARQILDHRGSVPRQYRNMLVFAAPDHQRLESLERAAADFLAWSGICDRVEQLDLAPHQAKQARAKRAQAEENLSLRLAEIYQWLVVPRQPNPVGDVELEVERMNGQGTVAQRASLKLKNEGGLLTQLSPVLLRARLEGDLKALWSDGHVAIGALWESFARYVYLPRLRDLDVLRATVEAGPASITWQTDGFAVALAIDETSGRYLGLSTGSHPGMLDGTALLVRPEFALGQLEQEDGEEAPTRWPSDDRDSTGIRRDPHDLEEDARPRRFHGTVAIDPLRPVKAFSTISEEIIQQLTSLSGAVVRLTIEIAVERPEGFDERTVRAVTENSRVLKFDPSSGFEDG